jgi:hypothetical protein
VAGWVAPPAGGASRRAEAAEAVTIRVKALAARADRVVTIRRFC